MVKKITVLEEMGCWTILKLTSIPRDAKLISSRWVYQLKYCDGVYERHKARLVALGYQQEKAVITLIALHLLVLKQHSVLFSLLRQFPVGILWISMPCVFSSLAILPEVNMSI